MVDFSTSIQSLLALGLSQDRIAELVGTSQPTINRILVNGLMPRYDIGYAILYLARRLKHPRRY